MGETRREYSTSLQTSEVRDWLLQLIDPDHNMEWARSAGISLWISDKEGLVRITFKEREKIEGGPTEERPT